MSLHLFRLRSLGLFLALLGLGAVCLSRPAAAEVLPAWFGVEESVHEAWTVRRDPVHPDTRVQIYRRTGAGIAAPRVAPDHRVMLFYTRRSSAYDVAVTKMLSMFQARDIRVEVTAVFTDNGNSAGEEALRWAEARGMDLIFSMGSQATAWLWNNYRFGDIPVVSVTAKDPVQLGQVKDYDQGSGTNFAFTSLNMPVDAQLAYVLELKPDLKNLAILVDANNISAVETQARPMEEAARSRGIQVLLLEVQNADAASQELEALVSRAVPAMRRNDPTLDNSLFWITGSTAVFREIATINQHSDRVPVLSVVPEVVQEGEDSAVLSVGVSFQSNAHLATLYGLKILSGEQEAATLPVGLVSPPDIAINFRKARQIGLKIPFSFFEGASTIYDYDGNPARLMGEQTL